MKIKIKRTKTEIKVVSVYFPTDNGQWTDQIISSLEAKLSDLPFKHTPFEFKRDSWSFGRDVDKVVSDIEKLKPDVVFLPDDQLYRLFAKKIEEKTGAFILFSTFYTEGSQHNEAKNQAGVYVDPPVKQLLTEAKKMFPINKVGIVGGPFAKPMIDHFTKRIPDDIKVTEIVTTADYREYSASVKRLAKSNDSVWLLAPFGVIDGPEKQKVPPHRVQSLIDGLNKPVIGWGRVGHLRRSFEMTIQPQTLGEGAASKLIDWLRDDQPSIGIIDRVGISCNPAHLKQLNIKVPAELLGTITSR